MIYCYERTPLTGRSLPPSDEPAGNMRTRALTGTKPCGIGYNFNSRRAFS